MYIYIYMYVCMYVYIYIIGGFPLEEQLLGVSIVMGITQYRWFTMENPNLKWMTRGCLHFRKPSYIVSFSSKDVIVYSYVSLPEGILQQEMT